MGHGGEQQEGAEDPEASRDENKKAGGAIHQEKTKLQKLAQLVEDMKKAGLDKDHPGRRQLES